MIARPSQFEIPSADLFRMVRSLEERLWTLTVVNAVGFTLLGLERLTSWLL